MKSAHEYTDSATVAERDYGRKLDAQMDAYEMTDPRECRLQAESDWWDEINTEGWTLTDAQERIAERAMSALCRLAEHAAGRAPRLYADDGYQRDLDRLKEVRDQWIEDRAERIRQGEV